jgi:serine protease Do
MKRLFQLGTCAWCAMVFAIALVCAGASFAAQPHAGGPRTPGYLGVAFHDAPNGQHGAEIVMVDHDGPAGKAGLQEHDIVTKLNGLAVESGTALSHMIHETGAGAQVALAVLRGGRSITVTTELADRNQVARSSWQDHWNAASSDESAAPESEFMAAAPAPAPQIKSQGFIENMLRFGPYTGLMVSAMEPQLAGYFGCANGKGLLVHAVEANSPAAVAGLRAGDVLLRADGAPLNTASEWSKSLRVAKGHQMTLTVLREHHEMNLTLLPDAKKHSQVEWPQLDETLLSDFVS